MLSNTAKLIRTIALIIISVVLYAPTMIAQVNQLVSIKYTSQSEFHTLLEFQSQTAPDFEIFENIKSKIIIIKFRNTKLGNVPKLAVFEDTLIQGLKIQQIDTNEYWVKIKTHFPDLLYKIIRSQNQPTVLGLQLYKLNLKALKPIGPEIISVLRELNPNSERLHVYSDKPIQFDIVRDNSLAEKPVQIRFLNARLIKDMIVPSSQTDMLKSIRFEQRGKYLVMFIVPQQYSLNIKKEIFQDPIRLVLEVSEDRNKLLSDLEAEEQAKRLLQQEENQDENEKEAFLTEKFREAERSYRVGRFQTSALLFKNIYNASPNTELGIRANFRSADSLYQYQLVKKERDGDQFVIQEHKIAINSALEADLGYSNIPRAYYNIGRSYLNLRFYEDAFNQFEILIKLYPESPYAKTALFHQGIIHLNMLRYSKSIEALEKYTEENLNSPRIPAAYYKIGEAQFQLRQYTEAKKNFDRAWSLDPNYMEKDAELMFHMGEAYFENGDLHIARSIYEKMIDMYPKEKFSNLVAIRIGDLFRDEDKHDDAIKAYEKAINKYPEALSLIGKLRIANILAERPEKDFNEKAIKIYDFIIDEHSLSDQYEEALLRKSLTQALFQDYPNAISTMEKFCSQFPDNLYVKHLIIQDRILETIKSYIEDYYFQGRYLDALSVFEQYEKQYYTHPKSSACFNLKKGENYSEIVRDLPYKAPLFLIADSYFRLGLHDKAQLMNDIILKDEKNPLVPLILFNKGKIFDLKDQPEDAQQIYARFIYNYPENVLTPLVKKALGDSYFKVHKSDRISRAIRIYRQTVKDYQNSSDMLQREIVPSCWFALANLYRGIGEYDNAIDSFKNSINTYEHPLQDPEVEEYIVEAHFILGNLYYELNQIPEAFETYTNGIQLFPDSEQAPWAKYQVGQIYVKNNQREKAIVVFEELMEAAKKSPEALWGPLSVESHKSIVNELQFDKYLDRTPSPVLN